MTPNVEDQDLMSGMAFKAPVTLDDETHATAAVDAKQVRKRHGETAYCQINVLEFAQAAKWFPIVFALDAPHVPIVVMSFEKNKNLFADPKTGWEEGIYMPKGMAQYPVCANGAPIKDKGWPMSIDTTCLAKKGGERLFAKDAEATVYLKTKVGHGVDYAQGHADTLKFGTLLAELDLFKRVDQTINTANGPVSTGSFMVVDIEKLNALSEETKADLKQRGIWQHVVMHAESLSNFDQLIARTEAPQI